MARAETVAAWHHGDLAVHAEGQRCYLGDVKYSEDILIDPDGLRWLMLVAIPAALAFIERAEKPSAPPPTVQENDQLESQLAIGVDDG